MVKVNINEKVFTYNRENGADYLDGEIFPADVIEFREGRFHILQNNRSYVAEIISFDRDKKIVSVKVNNTLMDLIVKDEYDELLTQMGIDVTAGAKINEIKAPMPGMVLTVLVENGQQIKKGDAIVVLEAMKMENILKSPADGIINRIFVTKGDKVEKNQVMVNFD